MQMFQAVEGLYDPLYLWLLWFPATLTMWQLASEDGVEGLHMKLNPDCNLLTAFSIKTSVAVITFPKTLVIKKTHLKLGKKKKKKIGLNHSMIESNSHKARDAGDRNQENRGCVHMSK